MTDNDQLLILTSLSPHQPPGSAALWVFMARSRACVYKTAESDCNHARGVKEPFPSRFGWVASDGGGRRWEERSEALPINPAGIWTKLNMILQRRRRLPPPQPPAESCTRCVSQCVATLHAKPPRTWRDGRASILFTFTIFRHCFFIKSALLSLDESSIAGCSRDDDSD